MALKFFRRINCLLLFVVLYGSAFAGPLKKGFEALAMYDYFKAKKLFYKTVKKKPDAYAYYGLATIFHRNDNPFHNADSALKYLNRGWEDYCRRNEKRVFDSFAVDSIAFRQLADSISTVAYRAAAKADRAGALDTFLSKHFLAEERLRSAAVGLRDRLELNGIRSVNQSSATAQFLVTHPESPVMEEATSLYERQVFSEITHQGDPKSYVTFLKQFPENRMAGEAQEWLYNHYSKQKDIEGLAAFVKNYPESSQNEEAWKLLFSLSVKSYNYTELKRFLDQYPEFPLKNSILRELELNRRVLYPFVRNDLTGYINEDAEVIIGFLYHAASDFRQGLAVVHRNDTAWFINKEGKNPFDRLFREAGPFSSGVAPVLTEKGWFFINRLGQQMTGVYEEVNEISDGAYVVKKNGKYGAVDQFGQTLIEPRFEKLGDFVNGYAYYTQDEVYGFVDKNGSVHPPEFGWISDFSEWRQAVVKIAGKFGLTDYAGRTLLPTEYDQLLRQNDSVYVVVKDGKYGFWHAGGCFIYLPEFEYHIALQSGRFTNGVYFKLHENKKQAIGNLNGHLEPGFGVFDEVFVVSDSLVRFRKRDRFGYADMQSRVVIPPQFERAGDFEKGVAVVRLRNENQLIDRAGKVIHVSAAEYERLGSGYFITTPSPSKLINSKGQVLFEDVADVQQVADGIFALERTDGSIRLLYD